MSIVLLEDASFYCLYAILSDVFLTDSPFDRIRKAHDELSFAWKQQSIFYQFTSPAFLKVRNQTQV